MAAAGGCLVGWLYSSEAKMSSMFSSPKTATIPNPPTAATSPTGTAKSASGSSTSTALAAQRAAALQGGTVMSGSQGASTTKTLLGQ